jgi:hypothetical protein
MAKQKLVLPHVVFCTERGVSQRLRLAVIGHTHIAMGFMLMFWAVLDASWHDVDWLLLGTLVLNSLLIRRTARLCYVQTLLTLNSVMLLRRVYAVCLILLFYGDYLWRGDYKQNDLHLRFLWLFLESLALGVELWALTSGLMTLADVPHFDHYLRLCIK